MLEAKVLEHCAERINFLHLEFETEEHSQQISHYQGELKGIKDYLVLAGALDQEALLIDFTNKYIGSLYIPIHELSDEDLRLLCEAVAIADPEVEKLKTAITSIIQEKKNF